MMNFKYQIINNSIEIPQNNIFEIFSDKNYVEYLIKNNIYTVNNEKLIHYICKYSHDIYIKRIIDLNDSLEHKSFHKWRPIHSICRYASEDMIKLIINKEVSLECETE